MNVPDDLEPRSTTWTGAPSGAQSAGRVLQVLRLLATNGGATDYGCGLGDLVRVTGLAKPTVHRLLAALVATGFAERDPRTSRYRLGAEAQLVGALAARRTSVQRLARPLLADLAARTRETVLLTVRREHECLCLHREDGLGQIRTYVLAVGDTHPLGVNAGGLALLAAEDDEAVAASLDRDADWIATDYPLLDRARILDMIAATRRQGWSFNDGRVCPGAWGVAMALPDGSAAITVAGVEQRMRSDRRREIAGMLRAAVGELERLLRPGRAAVGNTA
ncbi:IclR family transcriptional regulator [Umezawaea sp. Da 62-37]|uniref:IclR family transcriptional regulator n=1 Tax=Umezawaea sp. Da 62-37 TaxID=3075927 RepID=UPI0028F7133E|nr:IclR family transcriptional regulator [Umezawaea sp. Da 62-37]WNV85853.1 IclR family transcriptional regulator [Umezawaea sp. Da 62-37]